MVAEIGQALNDLIPLVYIAAIIMVGVGLSAWAVLATLAWGRWAAVMVYKMPASWQFTDVSRQG